MSQTFKLYNFTKEEFIHPYSYSPLELATNPKNCSLLLYLLNNNIPDKGDPDGLSGHWAGDKIGLMGGYHPEEIDKVTKQRYVIEVGGRELTTTQSLRGPISTTVSDCSLGDTITPSNVVFESRTEIKPLNVRDGVFIQEDEVTPGDLALLRGVYTDKIDCEDYKCVKVKESLGLEWTDFTKSAMDAYENYTNTAWMEAADEMEVLNLDMVVSNHPDEDKPTIYQGLQTTDDPSEQTPENIDIQQPTSSDKNTYSVLNTTQQEYFTIDADDLRSIITHPLAAGMLTYLLCDSVQDGTRFAGLHNPRSPELETEMQEKMRSERERYQNKGRSSPYRNEDSTWDKKKLARVVAAKHMISEDFLYAGRWCEDNISVIEGSPKTNSEYNQEDWVSISDRLRAVFAEFVSPEWIENNGSLTAGRINTNSSKKRNAKNDQENLESFV